jgi:TetR/AcrR family transcriptional regulator, transcriptional repressor for nem operon
MSDTELHPTKLRILEVAFRLFHEQGYHATGVSTILREAGVNSGSLYHYFDSKEDLLLGVLEWMLGALRPRVMEPAEAQATDAVGRVFALLGLYRMGLEMTGCKMGCPAGNLALEVSDDLPAARSLIDQNFQNWADQVAGWFENLPQAAPMPRDFDPRRFSRFVLTVMEGGIMQARARGSIEPFDESVAQLREYVELLHERGQREHTSQGAHP